MSGLMLSVSAGLKKNGYFSENDCNFVKNRAFFELSFKELNDAVASAPICFKYVNGGVKCFALFGYANDRNVFVLDDGSWACRFVPTEMKIFPFCYDPGQTENNEMKIYSDKLVDYDPSALNMQKVFVDEDIDSEKTSMARRLVDDHLNALATTRNVLHSLAAANVLKEWPLCFAYEEKNYPVENIYRVDQSALQGLDGNNLELLAKSGALYIAYAQILSEQRLNDLSAVVEKKLTSDNFRRKLLTGEETVTKVEGASFDL